MSKNVQSDDGGTDKDKAKANTKVNTTENTKKNAAIMDSKFIPLDDLVYAPIHALAISNQKLRADIVDAIRNMGVSKQDGQDEVIHLKNINIAYEQVRSEGDDGYSVDNLKVQVPLLSIIPITNLAVEKAEIDFSTEIKIVDNPKEEERKIVARICSPAQRESDFLPRVSYKLNISSIPATEGILRLTDALNSSQVAKKIDSTPVAVSGDLGSEEQKNIVLETMKLKAKISRLKQLHQKISDTITEQEKLHKNSKNALKEGTYDLDRDNYMMAQSKIINRIMEYQKKIIDMEISYGLDKEYE
ncbi:DUF2589 domain-containing protein [Ruminiclostridium herbifermentans]|uniref:DUF2589 domain-containing protein n=1 Tax=Ruminiclostridium herbifermentans TaxID=2488810 RepID=A0A4U7J8B7_9FIRM|nr:DUF2589 domain-containing protein [Ruminiclostridium herbifermentans]QNU66746.1 DUF2589 domain-containing protein [Ruminiclostridium herbifermentans]